MKKLNNILYVTTPNAYLSQDGENIVIKKDNDELARIPFHNIEGIITFGYTGASPSLMGTCAKKNIALTFLSMHGRFLARVCGEQNGNVVLRKAQYRISDNEQASLIYAQCMILGKLYNARWVLERGVREHSLQVDIECLKETISDIVKIMKQVQAVKDLNQLRGFEGIAATKYFSVFGQLILQQKEDFAFRIRSKRPPMDNVNALLSFMYTILAHDCASALESVGLDSYVGFLHKDRPGRISLALDLMEEFRSVMVDRFVLTIINKKIVTACDFKKLETGAVSMDDEARRKILGAWQNKKNEKITHPFLNEKMEWGMLPFVQAQLLAKAIRGDLDEYPPFFWK